MRNSIKQNRAVGWLIERCRFSRRERAFAETWMKENRRESTNWIYNDVLQKLFLKNSATSIFGGRPKIHITARDRFIVATVIQWLGTNIGWCFLEECLKRAGFKLVPTSDNPDREYYQPFDNKYRDGSAWNNLMAGFERRLSTLPERQMTRPFKKKHLLRYRHMDDAEHYPSVNICIRCGWIKNSNYFNHPEKPCLWDQESIDRCAENQAIIDRPDRMPDCLIKQKTGSPDTYQIEFKRGLKADQIHALTGELIRLNGFTKRVLSIAPWESGSSNFQWMAIVVVSPDPPYGKTKS